MLLRFSALLSLVSFGAVFGFFYAWVCSTMWGLDQIDPNVAITAMQGMNASVRNEVFAVTFFGTPFYAALTAFLAWRAGYRDVAWIFAGAGGLYIAGGMVLTMSQNVPMNEALALVPHTVDAETAAQIWNDYSPRWQVFNQIRTVLCAGCLALAGWGLLRLGADVKQA
ncbi:anthrone oxygenase family protein [Ascidiaceihabitans sp.]|uniref:anthrone oxygenase family protein n=1 Tax=Ascidiaceihabitans sp. TaxID=1872644 RepID=UPI003299C9A6